MRDGDLMRGFTPTEGVASAGVLFGLAVVAYMAGRRSTVKMSILPPLGTLLGTYVAFRALDAIWPDALKSAPKQMEGTTVYGGFVR